MSSEKLLLNFAPTFKIAVGEVPPGKPFTMAVTLKKFDLEKRRIEVIDAGNWGFEIHLDGNDVQLAQVNEHIKEMQRLGSMIKQPKAHKKKKNNGGNDERPVTNTTDEVETRIELLLFGLVKGLKAVDFMTSTVVVSLRYASVANIHAFLGKGGIQDHTFAHKAAPKTPEKETFDRLTKIQKGHADGKIMEFTLQVIGIGECMERSGTYKGRSYFKVQLNNVPSKPQARNCIEVTIWDSQCMKYELKVGSIVKFSHVRCQVRSTQTGETYPTYNVNLKGNNIQSSIMMVENDGEFQSVLNMDEDSDDPEGA